MNGLKIKRFNLTQKKMKLTIIRNNFVEANSRDTQTGFTFYSNRVSFYFVAIRSVGFNVCFHSLNQIEYRRHSRQATDTKQTEVHEKGERFQVYFTFTHCALTQLQLEIE